MRSIAAIVSRTNRVLFSSWTETLPRGDSRARTASAASAAGR